MAQLAGAVAALWLPDLRYGIDSMHLLQRNMQKNKASNRAEVSIRKESFGRIWDAYQADIAPDVMVNDWRKLCTKAKKARDCMRSVGNYSKFVTICKKPDFAPV